MLVITKRPRINLNDAQKEFIFRKLKEEEIITNQIVKEIIEELKLECSNNGLKNHIITVLSPKMFLGKNGIISKKQIQKINEKADPKDIIISQLKKDNQELVGVISDLQKQIKDLKSPKQLTQIVTRKEIIYYEYV